MKELPVNQIICGDCLEVMKDWPDKCVDLTVTSPPYGDLRDYKGYSFDFEGIANELYRVTKQGGVVVWVVGDQTVNGSESGESFRQALGFMDIGFRLHDTMIFNRPCAYPGNVRYSQDFEYMFVLSKGKPITTNIIRDIKSKTAGRSAIKRGKLTKAGIRIDEKGNRIRPEYKERPNIWTYNAGGGHNEPIAYEHPAIFPEQLAKDHILSWSNSDDLILDPMCGSGTVPKMARLSNRRFIGIDISHEYCKIAEERLKAVDTGVPAKEARQGQKSLFENMVSEVIYYLK